MPNLEFLDLRNKLFVSRNTDAPNSTVERINAGSYSILTDGTKVQIVVRMDYSDSSAATPEVVDKFNKGIEKYWSGKFGKYLVKTFVTTVTNGPRFNPG